MNILKNIIEYTKDKQKLRKIVGSILILIGLFALFTPLTPGSWLAIIGLELLGLPMLFLNKFKFWDHK